MQARKITVIYLCLIQEMFVIFAILCSWFAFRMEEVFGKSINEAAEFIHFWRWVLFFTPLAILAYGFAPSFREFDFRRVPLPVVIVTTCLMILWVTWMGARAVIGSLLKDGITW